MNACVYSFQLRTAAILIACLLLPTWPAVANDFTLLFMGDNGHHQPPRRFQELAPALAQRGIELQYTDRMEDINPETLSQFDGLVLYANIDTIEQQQADALLAYVAEGHGFIPLHCATYCWRNNPEIVALMGGQFQRHGTGVFTTVIAEPEHPIMKGYDSFTSWDETYIHHLHNEENRTVLEYRVGGEQAEGRDREPWTWVRTHGEGRVFYTAWGHDQRTFNQAGFQNLVERGIRWACGGDPGKVPPFHDADRFVTPEMTPLRSDAAPFEYVDVGPKIPNYTPSRRWGTQGEPKTLMQQPLSPEESIKHFVTPEGLTVRLYADERDFQSKPIAMTWDERGRLWICETLDYPNEFGKDRDRIRICEDTDGDHVADKFTVFAEGLSIPTAIVIVRGGAVVQNGTETIFLKDTDGDDVADLRRTLISGWALGDTHGGVSNFRYGLDNWIWAMQGYNNSSPEFNGQQSQSFRQGFWRFRLSDSDPPQVTELEFLRSSDNNTWGLGISEDGLIFGSTANHNPSMFLTIPNRYYERVRGWAPSTLRTIADTHEFHPITDNVRQVDHHGGYTAGAGHALYTARAFPQQWWNKTAFVCGPTGHLIGTFVLRRDGANFQSTSPVNLLASDDEWSAPIMAEVGPDGAVWVIDWYNYIVQHNPTPNGFETGKGAAYESDLRDKRRGRIYRVVPEDTDKLHEFESLADASHQRLVDTLKHPSMRWRLHAQRLLLEQDAGADPATVEQLRSLITDQSVDSIGLNVAAIHALHTLADMSLASREYLAAALQHPSAAVRRNALAVLPTNNAGLEMLQSNANLLRDSDLQVRLQAVLTLSDMPESAWAGQRVASLVGEDPDPVLGDALTSAAAAHAVGFLESVTAVEGDNSRIAEAISRRVAEHLGRGRPTAESLRKTVAGLSTARDAVATAILDGLIEGLPDDYSVEPTPELVAALTGAFAEVEPALKVKLLRLSARCDIDALDAQAEEIVASIRDTLADEEADTDKRLSAAKDLVGFRSGDDEVVEDILDTITPQSPPAFAIELVESLKTSEAAAAGELLVDSLQAFSPSTKSAAISVLLSKPAWTKALLDAVEANEFDLDELSLDQKQALRSLPNPSIRQQAETLLARGGGLPDADREKVLQSLMHVTTTSGDVENGKAVFKKVCSACHQYGELGQKVGPNLTGMAAHPKAELLTHILDPSRNVEGNYRLYKVLTIDGLVLNGMLAGESKTSLTLVDGQGKEIQIPREDIEQLVASRKSVMPDGFEKQISESELADLLEFLTNSGPYVPIPLDDVATAISTKGLFHDGDNGPDRMVFPDWEPKIFNGVPFLLTDPQGKTQPNIVLLHGPYGSLPPQMPKSVVLPCGIAAAAIHMLSGVGGWNHPYSSEQTVSMIIRLHYEDGTHQDHELINGVHFADYIRRVDVPGSEFAFGLGGQQIRYLSIQPERDEVIERIEFVKGEDNSAPIVMAVTVEKASSQN